MIKILGTILFGLGILLLFIWFGTRSMLSKEGTWGSNKIGAYQWLVIDIILIVVGALLIKGC